MSVKFQITLSEDLAADLKARAAELRIPLAQFVRASMEEKLRDLKSGKREDPFAWMDGLAKTHETDLASRIDQILYHDAGIH